MYRLRQPTEKQKNLAMALGIRPEGKSFRVLSAEIADALELKAFATVEEKGIMAGSQVVYVGKRDDMPHNLTVSKMGKNGYLYFKGTSKYCRPWDVEIIERQVNRSPHLL